jgi:hypothetical protein
MYEWTNFTFWLAHFAFWALSTQASCAPDILLKNQKVPEIFKCRFLKNMMNHPHEYCLVLLDIDSLVKEITNLTSHFTWEKHYFWSTESCQECWFFGETDIEATDISRCSGILCSVHSTYNTDMLEVWYPSVCRYTFRLAQYWIWIWVIHLGFENHGNSAQKSTPGSRKNFKARPPTLI